MPRWEPEFLIAFMEVMGNESLCITFETLCLLNGGPVAVIADRAEQSFEEAAENLETLARKDLAVRAGSPEETPVIDSGERPPEPTDYYGPSAWTVEHAQKLQEMDIEG